MDRFKDESHQESHYVIQLKAKRCLCLKNSQYSYNNVVPISYFLQNDFAFIGN